MNKQAAFDEINRIQDEYIDELIRIINTPDYANLKAISFTSATGTGKTKMMSKLINKFPDYYFIITTLSKGQLHHQVRNSLMKDCNYRNFTVYGSADYKINSRLDAMGIIKKIPPMTRCIWLRDEGHIKTNRFDELLLDKCYKVINFSATNQHSDIQCNFTQTMMLRTVNQTTGTPEEAINKLIEVKELHKNVIHYNPCAIFRCVGGNNSLHDIIVDLCIKHGLKYIDISNEPFTMSVLCEDDNEYDVIINKFKLIEGIDIRRAHVLYMDNQPNNNATTIQAIGRCRRNALLYRDDIDILAPENEELLKGTRECYVYYNVEKMKISTDENGELQMAFCNYVSCEELKPNTTIDVVNGQLPNGLYIIELDGKTGRFDITIDENTGFNTVVPTTDFYDNVVTKTNNYIYTYGMKITTDNVLKLPLCVPTILSYSNLDENIKSRYKPYYILQNHQTKNNVKCNVSDTHKIIFSKLRAKYTEKYLHTKLSKCCFDAIMNKTKITKYDNVNLKEYIETFLEENKNKYGLKDFCRFISNIGNRSTGVEVEDEYKNFCLHDFCDQNELLLFQYCCIKQKEKKTSIEDIKKQVERFINLMVHTALTYNKDNLSKRLIYTLFDEKADLCNKKIVSPSFTPLTVKLKLNEKLNLYNADIADFFYNLDCQINGKNHVFLSFNETINQILELLSNTEEKLKNNIIDTVFYSYDELFEELDSEEEYMVKNKYIKTYHAITQEQIEKYNAYKKYEKILNDKESAIVGVDLMRQIRFFDTVLWIEASSVSSKVGNYNKLNAFLSNRYASELEKAKSQYFKGKNTFNLDKKCNSIIGYCVEYYSKYLVYGESFLFEFIEQAKKDSNTECINNHIIINACMLKYKQLMIRSFGTGVSKIIKTISVHQLIQEKYDYFVNLVVELGTKTANYVKSTLYVDKPIKDDIDPNLSIRHIAGLADYITSDTILDVKVRNYIDENCVRQVLAYHYLSTKRSDLNINRVIVYDAVSDKSIILDIK